MGTCRWCGTVVLAPNGSPSTRARWHAKCVAAYKLIHWPAVTRRAVKRRDKNVCAGCGKKSQKWQMDHIKPLIESNGDLRFWELDNLQTLCEPCHHAKTGQEATARAAVRRAEKEVKLLDDGRS